MFFCIPATNKRLSKKRFWQVPSNLWQRRSCCLKDSLSFAADLEKPWRWLCGENPSRSVSEIPQTNLSGTNKPAELVEMITYLSFMVLSGSQLIISLLLDTF